jgi:predicted metalloprotease with PDZ domain
MGLTLTKEYAKDTPYANSKTDKPGALGIRTRSAGDRVIVSAVLSEMPAYDGGVNVNDELSALNGQRLDSSNASKVLADIKAGQKVTLSVFRREQLTNIEITAAVKPFDNYVIVESKDATDAQKRLRIAWIGEDPKKDETKK